MRTAATAIRKINQFKRADLITETTRKNAIAYIKTLKNSEDIYTIEVDVNLWGHVYIDTFDNLGEVIQRRTILNEFFRIYY